MVSDEKYIRRMIDRTTKTLVSECGCTVTERRNGHKVVTIKNNENGEIGTITFSTSPRNIVDWKYDTKRDLRNVMKSIGLSDDNISKVRQHYRLFTTEQGIEELRQLENLIRFCKSRTKLDDEEIEQLYLDRQENFPITQLVEKYGVSKTTIYRYLKVYKTIQKTHE